MHEMPATGPTTANPTATDYTALRRAIESADWHRYDGGDPSYVTAGTFGTPDAIDLRIRNDQSEYGTQPIEYRRVTDGRDAPWLPTGYAGYPRYDPTRDETGDGEGWAFHPYRVTDLHQVTR